MKSRTVDIVVNNNSLRFKIKIFQRKVSPYINWVAGLGTAILLLFAFPPAGFVIGVLSLLLFFSFDLHIQFTPILPVMRKTDEGNVILGLPCEECGRLNEYDLLSDRSQPSNCEICGNMLIKVASKSELYKNLIEKLELGEEIEFKVGVFNSEETAAFVKTPNGTLTPVHDSDNFTLEGIAYDEPHIESPRTILSFNDETRLRDMLEAGENNFKIYLANKTTGGDWGIGIVAPDGITGIVYGKELTHGFVDAILKNEEFHILFGSPHTDGVLVANGRLSEIDIGMLKQLRKHAEYQWIPKDRESIERLGFFA